MTHQPEDVENPLEREYSDDLMDPEDGRDGTPYEGSSDNPETMQNIDPLRNKTYLYDDESTEELEDLH
mgnify:CR=1 FL=1